MKTIVSFLALAMIVVTHSTAQTVVNAGHESEGEQEMRRLLMTGLMALGLNETESAQRMRIIEERASHQKLDTLLRDAAIVGLWLGGFSDGSATSSIRLPDELVKQGYETVYFLPMQAERGFGIVMILNRALPAAYSSSLRLMYGEGSLAPGEQSIRSYRVYDGKRPEPYWAYEVIADGALDMSGYIGFTR